MPAASSRSAQCRARARGSTGVDPPVEAASFAGTRGGSGRHQARLDGGGRSTPAVEMSDLEAQLAKRDKEIAHLKAVNEKQTRNAFASEAEFERKLDAAEAAVKEAKHATREAKEKAAEQEETLKRKIKATKKKVEKERELVEAKDAELVRFTQKLQDVMNLLDAERLEKASLTANARRFRLPRPFGRAPALTT